MLNYQKAFNSGIEAAKKAELDINEINSVFEEFAENVKTASGGKIKLEIKHLIRRSESELTLSWPPKQPEKYQAIVADSTSERLSNTGEIAIWSIHKSGYPCIVTWNAREHSCNDKVALKSCLEELIGDPVTGQIFLRYLD